MINWRSITVPQLAHHYFFEINLTNSSWKNNTQNKYLECLNCMECISAVSFFLKNEGKPILECLNLRREGVKKCHELVKGSFKISPWRSTIEQKICMHFYFEKKVEFENVWYLESALHSPCWLVNSTIN